MKFNELNKVAEDFKIGGSKSDWMTLEVGDNRLRMVSEYEVLAKHFAGKGTIPMTCVGLENGCIKCQEGKEWDETHKNDTGKKLPNPFKPSVKFLLWVIDRKDNKIKILETGWSVIKQVADFGEDEEYKFNPETSLPDYDVNIKKTVKGSGANPSDTEYSVIASRTNKPLTPEEEKLVKEQTPIKEIVDSIKGKVLKEYQAMGIGSESPLPPADVPPLDETGF